MAFCFRVVPSRSVSRILASGECRKISLAPAGIRYVCPQLHRESRERKKQRKKRHVTFENETIAVQCEAQRGRESQRATCLSDGETHAERLKSHLLQMWTRPTSLVRQRQPGKGANHRQGENDTETARGQRAMCQTSRDRARDRRRQPERARE